MAEPLLIGTGNPDKARELAVLLEGLPWDVKSLAEFEETEPPEEDGATFEENALLKATFYSARFDLPTVADDSGLAVDALGGAPGIQSARYASDDCSYERNNTKLLEELAGRPWHERTARFICCAAFVRPGGGSHVFRGVVEGHIPIEPSGENGFGYDPLFVPAGHQRSFAEMEPREKEALSHRGQAFRELRAYLEQTG